MSPAERVTMIEELVAAGLLGAKGLAALLGTDEAHAGRIIEAEERRRELLEQAEALHEESVRLLLYG